MDAVKPDVAEVMTNSKELGRLARLELVKGEDIRQMRCSCHKAEFSSMLQKSARPFGFSRRLFIGITATLAAVRALKGSHVNAQDLRSDTPEASTDPAALTDHSARAGVFLRI